MDNSLHRHTPILNVIDPRGLMVRQVDYYRLDAGEAAVSRVERLDYDPAGRPVARWDARLDIPCQTTVQNMTGMPLFAESVDAGWRLQFVGDADQLLLSWDGRGSVFRSEYDNQLRPVARFEQSEQDEGERCVERLVYGGPTANGINGCGQLMRYDDSAGSRTGDSYDLLGAQKSETRRFLSSPVTPDWPEDEAERDALLEEQTYTTTWKHDAAGAVIEQTDARGNTQRQQYTVAGQLAGAYLKLAGSNELLLVSGLIYNAFGQVQSQTAGNGVISDSSYDEATGRLIRFVHRRMPSGEVLQDLTYTYDPVGNVLAVEDRSVPQRFWKNQRTDGTSSYRYDTLYQLVEATGRESAGAVTSSGLSRVAPVVGGGDDSVLGQYQQTYEYDTAGNLTSLQHTGLQSYTQTTIVSESSNRGLCHDENEPAPDFDTAFDANGNQLELRPGIVMRWDPRNQLSGVTLIQRKTAAEPDDEEIYCYAAQGQRARKIRTSVASSTIHRSEVRYLPGLELHTDSATGEAFEVASANAGCSNVRMLRWTEGKPDNIPNDQLRYMLEDHLGSVTLELDSTAELTSSEGYYPYGGTAWWAARSEIEAKYKTIRYAGKERDATGLCYYGYRYYAPWQQRWINPDPAGAAGGVNGYQFVNGDPIGFVDSDGRQPARIDILDFAPLFVAHAKAGRYDLPKKTFDDFANAGVEPWRSASTWNSRDFKAAAGGAQIALKHRRTLDLNFPGSDIVRAYGTNSDPFRQTALRGAEAYVPDAMSQGNVFAGFETVENANASMRYLARTLDALPVFADYNVALWSGGRFEGAKTFRGLLTWDNTENPRYHPGGTGTVPIGSIIQNRSFMSTSASPNAAAEFMTRQRDIPTQADRNAGRKYEAYDTFNSKRILAEFEHMTGRNVVPYVPEPQAEILFNLDTPFELRSVEKSDIGFIIRLRELDAQALRKLRELGNVQTFDAQWGLEPLSGYQLNTRQRLMH